MVGSHHIFNLKCIENSKEKCDMRREGLETKGGLKLDKAQGIVGSEASIKRSTTYLKLEK